MAHADAYTFSRTAAPLLVALVAGAIPTLAAPTPELLSPLAENRLRVDAPSEQVKRLEHIRADPASASVIVVRLNIEALSAPSLTFSVPGELSIVCARTRVDARRPGAYTWAGNDPTTKTSATFVVRDGDVTGSVTGPAGLFKIAPLGGGVHAVTKVDPKRMPPDEPPSFRRKQGLPQPSFVPGRREARSPADARAVQIDVLVAYTSAASEAVTNIDDTITLAIDETNQAYSQSGVNITLSLAASLAIDSSYSESGKSFDDILAEFKEMAAVNERRDGSNADIAVLVIEGGDYCGMADDILATADEAFAVVRRSCATGYYSFAHEIGHLQGARHNEQEDSSTKPFAYGHGYRHDGSATALGWRTIMSYDCPESCTRLQYLSDPDLTHSGGPMGTILTNDNVRVLNETALRVAAFRPAQRVVCRAFGNGYTSASALADAVYFRAPSQACIPDGTPTGTCRKWFGRCEVPGGASVSFKVFGDGYTSQTGLVDAVYPRGARSVCIPDGTPTGTCRKWFGMGASTDGRPVVCHLFGDAYSAMVGPTDAIYFASNGQVCMPDGTSTGTCRKWFGRCLVQGSPPAGDVVSTGGPPAPLSPALPSPGLRLEPATETSPAQPSAR